MLVLKGRCILLSKRIFIVGLSAICLIIAMLSPIAAATPAAPEVSAGSCILVEAESGRVLFEKDAAEPMMIASTTKIMTALVALENLEFDKTVTIRPEWTGIEGSSLYLKEGETMTVRDLLYGLMLQSGNDTAVALACITSGSVEDFAVLMNEKAAELGCTESNFVNPHGLDADGHLASARDLAKITAAAMDNAEFATIVSTKFATIAGRSLQNHNKMLWNYEGSIGVKTGYTKAAGRSLVSCAERDGARLICVTISAPDDWVDHSSLFDWAFALSEERTIARGTELTATVPVMSGVRESVKLCTGEAVKYTARVGAKVDIIPEVPPFIYAVVVRGGLAGTARVEVDGELIARVPILYAETIRKNDSEPLTEREKLKNAWYRANKYSGYGIGFYY